MRTQPGHSTLTPIGSPGLLHREVEVFGDRDDRVLRRVVRRAESRAAGRRCSRCSRCDPRPARRAPAGTRARRGSRPRGSRPAPSSTPTAARTTHRPATRRPRCCTRRAPSPKRSIAAAASACTDASSLTSVRTVSVSTPRAPMRSAAAASPASSTSASTTCMPALANRSANASPIPLAAPVTTATLPASSCMGLSFVTWSFVSRPGGVEHRRQPVEHTIPLRGRVDRERCRTLSPSTRSTASPHRHATPAGDGSSRTATDSAISTVNVAPGTRAATASSPTNGDSPVERERRAQRGRVAQARTHFVGLGGWREPERKRDVTLVHPRVPERVVREQHESGTWPGGDSASVDQPSSSRPTSTPRNSSFDATNWSNTSRGDSARMPSTINGGCAAGSNVASRRVGAPSSPARTDAAQKLLTVTMCETTSWTVQPSQRVADCHSSSAQAGEQPLHPAALPGDRLELIAGGPVEGEDRRSVVTRRELHPCDRIGLASTDTELVALGVGHGDPSGAVPRPPLRPVAADPRAWHRGRGAARPRLPECAMPGRRARGSSTTSAREPGRRARAEARVSRGPGAARSRRVPRRSGTRSPRTRSAPAPSDRRNRRSR